MNFKYDLNVFSFMKTHAFTNKNGTMALVKRFTKTNREVYNMSIVALLIGLGP